MDKTMMVHGTKRSGGGKGFRYRIIWSYDGIKTWSDVRAQSEQHALDRLEIKIGASYNYTVLDCYRLDDRSDPAPSIDA